MSPGGSRIRPVRLTAAVLALALALTACVAADPGADASSTLQPAVAADASLLSLSPDEALAHLEAQRGMPVVLNVWASWCPPCRDEAPTLAAAARRYEGSVVFLGVNFQDSRDGAAEFVDVFDWPFASIYDEQGAVARALGLSGIPVTVVLDADGNEVFRRVGSISETRLLAALDAVT